MASIRFALIDRLLGVALRSLVDGRFAATLRH
jgi:hypothetical protein